MGRNGLKISLAWRSLSRTPPLRRTTSESRRGYGKIRMGGEVKIDFKRESEVISGRLSLTIRRAPSGADRIEDIMGEGGAQERNDGRSLGEADARDEGTLGSVPPNANSPNPRANTYLDRWERNNCQWNRLSANAPASVWRRATTSIDTVALVEGGKVWVSQ